MTDTMPLRAWLDQAWNDHAEAVDRVLAGLADRAATLPDDADGAEAVRLAEHLLLAHRADPAALQQWLATLPPGASQLQAQVARAHWAVACVRDDGPPSAPLPDAAQRWRALQSVVLCDALRGRTARARERLFADEAVALSHPDPAARRAFAASANNIAGDLRSGARGDAARDALMVDAAVLARRAWAVAGDWMNVERADHQLAMCHAAVGNGAQAVAAASACLALCEAENADAVERFFGHECMVHALRASADDDAALRHRQRMAALLDEVTDPEMRAWCAQTLAAT